MASSSIQTSHDGKTVASILSDYDRFATRINDLTAVSESHLKLALSLFQWICFSETPLSLLELRHALNLMSTIDNLAPEKGTSEDFLKKTDDEMARFITTYSGGLLEIRLPERVERRTTVQFIDEWYKNFLLEEGFKRLLASNYSVTASTFSDLSHEKLLQACLYYLTLPEFKDCITRDESSKSLQLRLPFLRYAAISWVFHASGAGKLESTANLLFSTFCHPPPVHNNLWHTWIQICLKINIFGPCNTGTKLIHVASMFNMTTTFRRLLEVGVDIEQGDNKGCRAIFNAAMYGHDDLIRKLLELGASTVNLQHRDIIDDGSLISYAVSYSHISTTAILLDHGLKPSPGSVQIALQAGRVDIMKLLLEHGASVDIQWGDRGFRLLEQAVGVQYNPDMVELLLKYGADINAEGGLYGYPIIAAAAIYGFGDTALRITRMLIEAGADLNVKREADPECRIGTSALDTAQICRNKTVVDLLLAHGAIA